MCIVSFFFFNDTATTEIYTLSLHDALPIFPNSLMVYYQSRFDLGCHGTDGEMGCRCRVGDFKQHAENVRSVPISKRSEEHTSELQSQSNLVCRLLLEKKKKLIIESKILSQV